MATAGVWVGPVDNAVVLGPAEVAWFGPTRTWYPAWGTGRFWSLAATLWAEFLATTAYIFVAGFATLAGQASGDAIIPALGKGLTWACLLYAFRTFRGGDVNPALTISRGLYGLIDFWEGLFLIIGQTGGAFMGAFILWAIFDDVPGYGGLGVCQAYAYPSLLDESRIFGLEFTGSVILFMLVLRTEGAWFHGILCGLTHAGLISFFFSYTSGCFNPYQHLALAVVGDTSFNRPVGWGFYGAPFLAAFAAWLALILLAPEIRRIQAAEAARESASMDAVAKKV